MQVSRLAGRSDLNCRAFTSGTNNANILELYFCAQYVARLLLHYMSFTEMRLKGSLFIGPCNAGKLYLIYHNHKILVSVIRLTIKVWLQHLWASFICDITFRKNASLKNDSLALTASTTMTAFIFIASCIVFLSLLVFYHKACQDFFLQLSYLFYLYDLLLGKLVFLQGFLMRSKQSDNKPVCQTDPIDLFSAVTE